MTSTVAVLQTNKHPESAIVILFSARLTGTFSNVTYRNGSTVLSGSRPHFQQVNVIDFASLSESQAYDKRISIHTKCVKMVDTGVPNLRRSLKPQNMPTRTKRSLETLQGQMPIR